MAKQTKQQREAEALHAALRWTDRIERDMPVPSQGIISGWEHNVYSATETQIGKSMVYPAWSSSNAHGKGRFPGDSEWKDEGGRALYSSKLLALRGLRNDAERWFAETLRKIDKCISVEMANAADNNNRKGIA